MRPLPLVAAALLVVAAPASAAVVTPQTETLTAPAAMPVTFGGTALLFGRKVPEGAPIPAGAAVLQSRFDAAPGAESTFSVQCPQGLGNAGFGGSEPQLSGGIEAAIGARSVGVRFGSTAQAGPVTSWVLCLPVVSGRATVSRAGVRAPVRFARTFASPGLARHQRLPRRMRLVTLRLHGLGAGVAALTTVPCPGKQLPVLTQSATRGVKTVLAGGEALSIQPPRRTRATVYAVCASGRMV